MDKNEIVTLILSVIMAALLADYIHTRILIHKMGNEMEDIKRFVVLQSTTPRL